MAKVFHSLCIVYAAGMLAMAGISYHPAFERQEPSQLWGAIIMWPLLGAGVYYEINGWEAK